MDKLLVFTKNDVLSEKSSVGRKVYNQYRAFSEMFDTYLMSISENKIVLIHKGKTKIVAEFDHWFKAMAAFYKCANECVKKYNIPYVFIRYPMSDQLFINMLKKMKKTSRIIIEIPTYPYDNEIKNYGDTFKNRLAYYVDRLSRRKLKKNVYKIATYSEDKEIFGIPAFQVYNAVFVDDIKPREIRETDGAIHILGVAEMQQSHGYDRLISGLYEYYKNKNEKEVYLHLAGEGHEKKNYEALVKKYSLEKYVVFHGYCVGEKLEKLYNNSDLAVETLGLHRQGIDLSSSLKSREYLSKGLPMITSVKIDVIPEDYKYVLKVEANDNPVDINKVVDYYNSIYVDEQNDVVNDLREFAYDNCDIVKRLESVKDKFYEAMR